MPDEPEPHSYQLRIVDVTVIVVVVVVGIGVLLVLYGATQGRHRAACMCNQAQLSLAMLTYESAHGDFPGYANRIPTEDGQQSLSASWMVAILPNLDRNDLWSRWKAGDPVTPFMENAVCPSDRLAKPSPGTPLLSYVVNCGRPGDDDTADDGVFHNHDLDGEPVRVWLDYISQRDGATYTLLLSENLQAGRWSDRDEANVGMVWLDQPGPSSGINQDRKAGDRPGQIRYARPSSNHFGGVVVSFCDGHQQFIPNDLNYTVYQHIMTPDSAAAGVPSMFDPEGL